MLASMPIQQKRYRQQRFWPAVIREFVADIRRPQVTLLVWLVPLALVGVLRVLQADVPQPAPLSLAVGSFYTLIGLSVGLIGGAVQIAAASRSGKPRLGVMLLSRLVLVGTAMLAGHWLARSLGMPPLSHPASTTMALMVSALCWTSLGLLIGRNAQSESRAAVIALLFAGVIFWLQFVPAIVPAAAISPAAWARLAIQTAVTGTGTRAVASELGALAGLALLALLALRFASARIRLPIVGVGCLILAALVWQRPGPPLPAADMQPVNLANPVPPSSPDIAPIAAPYSAPDSAPDSARVSAFDPALASALARISRQIEKWPPAAEPEPTQRARNLLLIAAVADLYDTEPLQSHLPLLVEAELARRLPANQHAGLLASIAANPQQGSVAARMTLPFLGLPANTGDEARVRERVSLYAAKLLARQAKSAQP